MVFRVLLIVALGVANALAQTADGEIAGRITDRAGAALPGVQITLTNSAQSRAGVTDSDGQFVLRSLTIGTYRVLVELAGFTSTSGVVALSPTAPRAFLGWSLVVGCIEEDIRVSLSAREAAPLVDEILHIQVISADGPVLTSDRPECVRVLRRYSAQVLGSAPGRVRTSRGQRQIFVSERDAPLETGQAYVALLWPGGRATSDLVLPIRSGLVAPPHAGELNGMRVDEALMILGNWLQERKR
jgi:hypothetical protein